MIHSITTWQEFYNLYKSQDLTLFMMYRDDTERSSIVAALEPKLSEWPYENYRYVLMPAESEANSWNKPYTTAFITQGESVLAEFEAFDRSPSDIFEALTDNC